MRAEIIAVGSELLSFSRSETNSLFLASRFGRLGIRVARKFVVGDQPQEIREALLTALKTADLVALTGGLGPTNDDITREVVAETLGRPLLEDADILAELQRRYERFGLKLAGNNRKQAAVPRGATVLPNPKGTAPGLMLIEGETLVFLLPGPPRELYPMVDDQVLPLIRRHKKTVDTVVEHLKVAGEAESRLDARIESIYKAYPQIDTTVLSSPGIISLYFTWRGSADTSLARKTVRELVDRVRARLGRAVLTDKEEGLSEVVGRQLKQAGLTLAVAESCTGGLIGKILTDTAGSSDYFLGGIVAYANSVKSSLLGVDQSTLERCGAVSGEVAEQMAQGVRQCLGSDLGLSVTGIAGPGGGSEEKPVGTIFLGYADGQQMEAKKLFLPGDRGIIRIRTANLALDWVRRRLL